MARAAHPVEVVGDGLIQLVARVALACAVELRVEGAEGLPRTGATVIAARHYHFLFDALALLRHAPRPARFWVALDWTASRWQRAVMERLCRTARWPVALRVDGHTIEQLKTGVGAYTLEDAQPMLRAATRQAVKLLRAGETLLIFPEAYTTVDIFPTPKTGGPDFLPFRAGFVKLAQLAERDGVTLVHIVPAGFSYERLRQRRPRWLPVARPLWRVTLRFGAPHTIAARATHAEAAALVATVEAAVRALSEPASAPVAARQT